MLHLVLSFYAVGPLGGLVLLRGLLIFFISGSQPMAELTCVHVTNIISKMFLTSFFSPAPDLWPLVSCYVYLHQREMESSLVVMAA